MKLISNFDQLTKQDMFDMALAHVRKTGKQSMRYGACCYTGIGCAASVFIDPESLANMSKKNNGRRWRDLVTSNEMSTHEQSFVSRLQTCHDSYIASYQLNDADNDTMFMHHYEAHMRALAESNGLTYTPPTQPGESAM